MKLLNIDANAKTVKGQKKGYLTAVMYLAPADLSGFEVCRCFGAWDREIGFCFVDNLVGAVYP